MFITVFTILAPRTIQLATWRPMGALSWRCIQMIIPDDGGSTYLWNVDRQLFYTAVHPRRQLWTSYRWDLKGELIQFIALWCLERPVPFIFIHLCFMVFARRMLCSVVLYIGLPADRDSEPGSSGSTVSGYGLDNRAIRFRYPAEARDFSSSLCVQTSSEVHPTSCTMGTGGSFPRE
jgi:hypothetical protein